MSAVVKEKKKKKICPNLLIKDKNESKIPK